MSRWPRRLTRLATLPAAERNLLVEAAAWTVAARVAVAVLPFRWIAPLLGRRTAEVRSDGTEVDPARLAPLCRAIRRAGRHLPASCLVQALAGRAMLARRGLPCTVFLGAAPHATDGLRAHAWLTCGEVFVVGQAEAERYPVLATFASP